MFDRDTSPPFLHWTGSEFSTEFTAVPSNFYLMQPRLASSKPFNTGAPSWLRLTAVVGSKSNLAQARRHVKGRTPATCRSCGPFNATASHREFGEGATTSRRSATIPKRSHSFCQHRRVPFSESLDTFFECESE